MAKKAKRRGRPPGSKNKSTLAKLDGSVAKMDVGQLRDHIADLQDTLAAKIQQQRKFLEAQLAELQGYASAKAAGVKRTVPRVPRTGKRAKPKPKYRSKKNKSLKWTGRGMLPTWMREEMKGTKLKKDDFLIK
jgi:DNA-binding protein H-NS